MHRVIPQRTHSKSAQQTYTEHAEKQQHTMVTGPYLFPDGHTLIVPSEWYNEDAAALWSQFGFHWNNGSSTWERDTRLPLSGKRYTTEVWVKSTREKFFEFWPTLLKECRHCGDRFQRTNEYQIYCTTCTRDRRAATRFHDTNQ